MLAASVPFPSIAFLRNNGVRCFGFANVGTVSGLDGVPLTSILQSTRASVGGGVSMATTFGRLEATYAVPLRYSPRDARKSVQIGLGFSFG
jgi:outer membrane protein assembly factor BamA